MEKYQLHPRDFALIENSQVPVAVYQFIDKRVVTLALSAGFCELFGLDDRAEAYDVMDNDMYRDAHPDDVSRIAEIAFRFATEGGEYNAIYRSRARGEYFIVHARGRHIYTDTGVRLAVVWYADEGPCTSEGAVFESRLNQSYNRALRENSLYRENHYDALTGLPAMTYFFELADAARTRMHTEGRQFAILFFDLSGMKMFNRLNGFAEGDQLIRAMAKVLVRHFSNENCSRFGQDHFAVYTEFGPTLEATLKEILAECRQLNDGNTLPVRVGIYVDHADDIEISTACDRAKVACDAERKSYGSVFRYYDVSMSIEAMNRQHILDNLDRAIEERWIQVYYQPIIRAANGRVCNEEALARWIEPGKGLLSPAEFIPILEDAALLYKLDLCVLERALEKMRKQQETGIYVVPVSINLSRSDFDACDIVEEIRRRVDDSGFARSMVNIELTETVIGSDFEFMKEQIERFRALGFQVWMDDFGSGYSSLDLLQSLHFDLIKFDLLFMQKFENSEENRIILTELMKMALSIGVDTVVEGVETYEQAEFLREIGCTKLQGYYYAPPIPVSELKARYAEGRQIGFENPEESAYYAALGSVNLFNPTVISEGKADAYSQYFDTIPMAVMEVRNEEVSIVRCNKSYREMLQRVFRMEIPAGGIHNTRFDQQPELDFFEAVRQSIPTGEWTQFDREQENGFKIHAFVRRVAVNPVTGAVGVADIVLPIQAPSAAADADGDDDILRELHSVSANSVARALSADYLCIYYINAKTGAFHLFSTSEAFDSLGLSVRGDDFSEFIRKDAARVVVPEDLDLFLDFMSKEKMLAVLAARPTYTLTFRLIFQGAPRYVHLKATKMRDRKNGILIGVSDIEAQMQEKAAYERARSSSVTYAHIAQALSKDYVNLYYVDLNTERFIEYSSHIAEDDLAIRRESEDFFNSARRDALRAIYPEDQARFLEAFSRERVLEALDMRGVFTLNYRLMTDGTPTYVNMKASRMESDDSHIIIGVSSVDAQMKHQEAMERVKEERITYARIAALSGDFIAIYTVDPKTNHYIEYSASRDYEGLGFAKEGEDFFARARSDGTRTLYLEDLDLYLSVVTKENVLDTIARNGVFSLNYRLMIDGTPTFVNLKIGMIEEKDGPQLIVGVVNIDDQVKRDQKYAHDLSVERDRANFDALTGVKNKHAYIDVEARLNQQIEGGESVQFAIVLCDVDELKKVNDTRGHQAGDRCLQRARSIICRIFQNSPVFRVGGDEFAVIIQGQDYDRIEEQLAAFAEENRKNAASGDITVAFGMARYVPGDRSVSVVFERADSSMYENKRQMNDRRD